MAETPRFEWLAEQFGALALSLGKTANSGQRKDLLKRMKVLIDEVDDLILEEYLRLNQDPPTDHAGNSNSKSG